MINITNLSVHYRESLALDKVSASIKEGELIAIVGPNGAGKSTLLKSVMQQLKPSTGSIDLGQRCLKDIAYLPQSHQIDRQFPITVREFVSAGSWQRISFWRAFGRTEQRLLQEALHKVNLTGVDDRQISTLSGGQFQRMLFARMLMQDADILLLDEPFNAIDAQTTEDLMSVIHDCQCKGKTILAVIHDLALVRRFFPNVMLIATQLIASGTTETVMTGENLAKAGYQYLSSELPNSESLFTPSVSSITEKMQPLFSEYSANSLTSTELPFYGRNIS